MKRYFPLLIMAVAALFLTGCSDNTTTPGPPAAAQQGVFGGEIGDTDFEIVLETAIGPDFPLQGPFVLRGRNLHYDDALGALVVDFTILNRGIVSHPLPISMTFIQLLPENVTVLNPDNDVHGPGASITFEFANEDMAWTPGEESLPRTVQFGVDEGTAIGFTARLDIGMLPGGGTIGGVVWLDLDRDGNKDGDERGIEGARIVLETAAGPDSLSTPPAIRRETFTAHDGSYRFDGLAAGHYVVGKVPLPNVEPTTPSPIHVLLVADGDGVSDFLMANFGCIPLEPPPPPRDPVEVGDLVFAVGMYSDFAGALFASHVEVKAHCDSSVTDSTGIEPPRPGDITPDGCDEGVLCGPVTGMDPDRNILIVMGTVYNVDIDSTSSVDPWGLQFRERVEARVVTTGPNHLYTIVELHKCSHERDSVRGVVESLNRIPDRIFGFNVAGIRVLVADIITPPMSH